VNIDVVILAAGKGTRMYSDLPKVLHPLAGIPLLSHVIRTASDLSSHSINVVVGFGAEQVKTAMPDQPINWFLQEQQLGTGHAVSQTLPELKSGHYALILYGDVPLINPESLLRLLARADANTLALLTVNLENPAGYGRIIRDGQGAVQAIVEEKDASSEQKTVGEVNTGIMAVPVDRLAKWLPQLGNNNAQEEYYLTDVIAMAVADGCQVVTEQPTFAQEVEGVNNRRQLASLERWHQQQQAGKLMDQGVTLLDPNRFDLRGELSIGRDCLIDINVVIEGEVTIGNNVTIGPNVSIRNASIADNTVIHANTVIDEAIIGSGCAIGPFARLRPGTHLAEQAKVGNFVETKKANVGKGSKINHLTYIGDSEIGEGVNVGAGTITCNYDGVNKFKTEIEDGAFIGSNTAIVAPVKIGKNTTIAAGSVVTNDVPEGALSVARGKQRNIDGWQRPKKK